MSATIPECEPSQFRAGDTLQFSRSLSDYPANAGWQINYSFRSTTPSPIDFSSTPSGTDHLVTVPAATTAGWLPGIYIGVGVVTDGTFVKTIWSGQLTVLQNLAAVQPGTDLRSQNRKILDFINCMIEKKAGNPLKSSTVEGTTFTWADWTDLLPLQSLYQVKVRNEEILDMQSQGKPTGRTIFAQFSRPK
jgi:hypothetical protein